MCQILVKAISAVHKDSAKDASGSYKQGDPVICKPDGHVWGKEEKLPRFWIIQIPEKDGNALIQTNLSYHQMSAISLENVSKKTLRRRKYFIDINAMTQTQRDVLTTFGTLNTTEISFKSWLKEKTS